MKNQYTSPAIIVESCQTETIMAQSLALGGTIEVDNDDNAFAKECDGFWGETEW